MLHRTERTFENIPVGPLGFIPVNGCQELGKKVDDYLVRWRNEAAENASPQGVVIEDYVKDSYIVDAKVPRFGSGEAKGIINESVRGKDIYIMEINEPFESCEILSFDKEIKNDDFCFWNIEGKSVDELLHRRDDIQPWHGVFLTQNEKKELFENGNGEALKLILDKFSLSDCFSEILFIACILSLIYAAFS